MPGADVTDQVAECVGSPSDRGQSAVIIPVPEAEDLVGSWRAVHDPRARTGVPAHITLVVPWLSPGQIKPEHLEALDYLLSSRRVFGYSLDRVAWFGERVLWLAPSPGTPFRELTSLLASHFDTPPWEGEFSEVVPHLTVGLAGVSLGSTLAEAAEDLEDKLPLKCRANEVVVMCGTGARWKVLHRVFLKGGD